MRMKVYRNSNKPGLFNCDPYGIGPGAALGLR